MTAMNSGTEGRTAGAAAGAAVQEAPLPKLHRQLHPVSKGHVAIENVSVEFKDNVVAVREASLDVQPGEFVCLLGPSGCGKSTLLNCVAGFVKPTVGSVKLDGARVVKPGPDRGMVFQQHSLFPWKTVKDNVAFGPLMAKQGKHAALCGCPHAAGHGGLERV